MTKTVFAICSIIMLATSCNRDHKKETISNYLNYVWRKQPGEIVMTKMEDLKSITGKDSTDLLIKEYARDIHPVPSLDTVLNRIERDINYNSKLLTKTNQGIDSLNDLQKKGMVNDDFFKIYGKIYKERKDFINQQLDEMKYYRSALKQYSKDPDKVYCYPVLCQYKMKGNSPDTTTKNKSQTFFLTPDTRRIYLVK